MNCKLIGSFIKHVEVELNQGEEFYAERGALIYMDEGITLNTEFVGRSLGKLIGAKLSGESLMLLHFTNHNWQPLKLAVGSQSGIVHFKLEGNELVCRKGAYMASTARVDISSKFSITGLIGGMSALLQRIRGNATVFLSSLGDPVVVVLPPGRRIRIDENHFLALEGITDDRISVNWSAKNVFSGEGLSMLTVTGPGRVFLNPGAVLI